VLRAYGVTDKGRVRATNEDYFVIDESLGLAVAADGMGGHNAGEVAARLAVDAIADFVGDVLVRRGGRGPGVDETWPFGLDPTLSEGGNLLRTAIHLANVQILEMASTSDAYAGMGTTVVAALVVGNRISIGHVGDSRAYRFAAAAGGDLVVRLRQLTHDDSWVATVLAQNPETDPATLRHHPMRNALTNVVGARPRIDVHVLEETLSGGERFLLTTDGVHGVLDQEQLEGVVRGSTAAGAMPAALVRAALARGSRDNCTAIVVEYISG
jgi:serine/threonine protein phosphatase PrpC